jgi:hypothetical protein
MPTFRSNILSHFKLRCKQLPDLTGWRGDRLFFLKTIMVPSLSPGKFRKLSNKHLLYEHLNLLRPVKTLRRRNEISARTSWQFCINKRGVAVTERDKHRAQVFQLLAFGPADSSSLRLSLCKNVLRNVGSDITSWRWPAHDGSFSFYQTARGNILENTQISLWSWIVWKILTLWPWPILGTVLAILPH